MVGSQGASTAISKQEVCHAFQRLPLEQVTSISNSRSFQAASTEVNTRTNKDGESLDDLSKDVVDISSGQHESGEKKRHETMHAPYDFDKYEMMSTSN